MKKVLSIVLAIAMIASMSAVAFAANETGSFAGEAATATATSNHEVFGTYATGARTDMYKVDIVWGSMKFTYTESAETWNTTDHTWDLNDDAAVGVWTPAAEGANKVDLENHSSKPVSVALAFADNDEDADVITGTWTNATVALEAPAEGADEGVKGSATLALEGKFTDEDATDVVIGTVTATIA